MCEGEWGVAREQEGETCFVSAHLTVYPDPQNCPQQTCSILYFHSSGEGSLLICASVFLSVKWIQEPNSEG